MHFTYAVIQFSPKCEHQPFPVVNSPIFCVSFEDKRIERTDFAVIHNSSSIMAGPSVALFQKLENGELSGKVFSWRAAIKLVTWQLLLVSCHFVRISLHTGYLSRQKLMQKLQYLPVRAD